CCWSPWQCASCRSAEALPGCAAPQTYCTMSSELGTRNSCDVPMRTYPIPQMRLAEALALQHRLVDLMHRHFDGREILQAGDYGADPALGRPRFTAKVEAVLADLFDAEDAVLVRGAG